VADEDHVPACAQRLYQALRRQGVRDVGRGIGGERKTRDQAEHGEQ
jgi:hypothetical protein